MKTKFLRVLTMSTIIASIALFSSCDPCYSTDCENGDCVNGSCYCWDNYTGPYCSSEVTPNSMTITSISILGYKENSCINFDLDDFYGYYDAEAYVAVYYNDLLVYSSREESFPNWEGTPLTFNTNIHVSNVSSYYTLKVFDRDEVGEDDLIWQTYFQPYIGGEGFPQNIILEEGDYACNNGDTYLDNYYKTTIGVEYNFY